MTKNIYNVSEEEKNRIRNLHLTESDSPAIKSTLKEASDGVDADTPMVDIKSPMTMGDNEPKPQARGAAGCKDVRVAGCPGTSGAYRVCVTIDGSTPTQSNIGDHIIYTPCTTGNPGALACPIGRVIEVCGPGGVGCSSLQNYQIGNTPFPQSTVPDCNYITGGGGWRCHPQDGCVDVSQHSGVAQFATQQDCLNSGCVPITTYDCKMGGPLSTGQGNCVPVQGSGGQYPTQQDCLDDCAREKRFECVPMETGPGPGTISEQSTTSFHCIQQAMGQYTTMSDCQKNCGGEREGHCINCEEGIMNTLSSFGTKECPDGWTMVTNLQQGPCYECDGNGNCIGPSWAYGPNVYNSQPECQQGTATQPACTPAPGWECVNNSCVQTPTGQYPTQAICQAQTNCGQPTLWECDTTNGCSQTANGTYQSQTQCETACCQDIISNWSWAQGSQSNPCQKFYNMFGPMGAINPNTLPFNQECIYNYLLNLILNLGGPCVQGNFINLLDNFMSGNNQCYGNPASGGVQGNPAQNSVCGKQAQFCSALPMTPSKYFKCQYAIQFANNNGCVC